MANTETFEGLENIPWRMQPDAKDYLRLAKEEGAPALRIANFALFSLAQDLKTQGIEKWEEVQPVHYEGWVRRRQAATLNASPMEREVFCGCHCRLDEFFSLLEERGKRTDNPTYGVSVAKNGVVRKMADSTPEIDRPIATYINERAATTSPSRQANLRSSLRSTAGSMLAHGIQRWPDLTVAKLDVIAKEWVDASRAAGKPSAISIQSRIGSLRVFCDSLEAKGVLKVNPADEVTVASSGRVTIPKDHDPKMYAQAQEFVESVGAESAASSHIVIARNITRFTHFCCGVCGAEKWNEVTPVHYEAFLRECWERNPSSISNAMFGQSTSKNLLSYLKAGHVIQSDPSEDIRFNSNGELSIGERDPEQLPQGRGQSGQAGLQTVSQMPSGFRTEAVSYHTAMRKEGKASSLVIATNVLPEFAAFVQQKGVQDWAGVGRPMVAEYGRSLLASKAQHTAGKKLSALRSFLNYLDENGKIPTHPAYGVKLIRWSEIQTPATDPSLEMEKEICSHVRKLPPQARESRREELYQLGSDLALRGRGKWSEVTREDLLACLHEGGPERTRHECKASITVAQAFYRDLMVRGVVKDNVTRRLAPRPGYWTKPSDAGNTPNPEECTAMPPPNELPAPRISPMARRPDLAGTSGPSEP